MTAAGDTFACSFSASIATATRAALTAQGSSRFPYDVYVIAVGGGSANAQYIEADCPGAWSSQTIRLPPISLPTVGYQLTPLPYAVRVPANTSFGMWGYQDSGGAEVVTGTMLLSKTVPAGMVEALFFTEHVAVTAGNGVFLAGAQQTVPSLPGAPNVRVVGGFVHGAGALVIEGGILADGIPGGTTYGERGPTWPGAADVSVNVPVFHVTKEDVTLQAGAPWFPTAKDLSGGTVQTYTGFAVATGHSGEAASA